MSQLPEQKVVASLPASRFQTVTDRDRFKESHRGGKGDCSTIETTMASEVSVSQSKVYLNVVPVVRYDGQEVTVRAFYIVVPPQVSVTAN